VYSKRLTSLTSIGGDLIISTNAVLSDLDGLANITSVGGELVIGLGLGGLENGFPPGLFIESFEEARRAGLRTVAHAGEAAGPESIWGQLKS
jgi:adenosine deaminase